MRVLVWAALALAIATMTLASSQAHSLRDVEQSLWDKEKYFQPVDVEAPNFTLQDANGRIVRLADLSGKVVVLNFIYINCTDFCPLHSERIAQLQSMINITPMKAMVEFVTITTDPKRDHGQALADYGKAHGLDPVNWKFLTAAPSEPDDSMRRIAEAYGVKFTEGKDGAEMHGIVTHVIDQDGRMRARFHGLDFQPVIFVIFVNALANRAHELREHTEPGSWEKLKGLF